MSLARRLCAYIALALVSLLALAPHARASVGTWQKVATHPEAVTASPTWGARWLWALYPWRGRLFVGYGSFNGANPRAVIRAFDPATNSFAPAPAFATDNEATGLFREIAGRLYVPTMDAHSGGLTAQNFAVTTDDRGDQWSDHAERLMYHTWDVATLDGHDLWFVGTDASAFCPYDYCSDAIAYRSTDGGASFREMIRFPAAEAGYRLAWFPFAVAFNGKLYLQTYFRFSVSNQPDLISTQSYTYDGRAWAIGPNLLPGNRTGESGYAPVVFDRHLVYLAHVPIARSYPNALPLWQNRNDLVVMDEAEHVGYLKIPNGVANFAVAGRYLYVLARDGSVRRTKSLAQSWRSWEVLPTFPVQDPDPQQGCAGRSIALLAGALYVGTTQAELWRLDLNKTQTFTNTPRTGP